jgi:hypothetical protein
MPSLSTVITIIFFILSLIIFIWLVIGVFPGFYFLFKFLAAPKSEDTRKLYLKRLFMAWGSVPALLGMSILYTIITLVLTTAGISTSNIPTNLTSQPQPTLSPQELQYQQQDINYYFINTLRTALRAYHYDYEIYPASFSELTPDYLTFEDTFDPSTITYTLNPDSTDYQLCIPLLEKPPLCVSKTTFLPPLVFSKERYLTETELNAKHYEETYGNIKSIEGNPEKLFAALLEVADWYERRPNSVEALSLYAFYLLEDGHLYSDVHYPETVALVEDLTKQAAQLEPGTLELLLMQRDLAWVQRDQPTLTAVSNKMLSQFGKENLVIFSTLDRLFDGQRITFLQTYLKDPANTNTYFRKTAYQHLIGTYTSQRKHEMVLQTYDQLIKEYNHPWDYQSLGLYWEFNKKDCEKTKDLVKKVKY